MFAVNMPRSSTHPKAGLEKTKKQSGSRTKRGGGGGGDGSSAHEVYRHIPVIQMLGKINKDPRGGRRICARMLELSPSTVRAMGNITLNALNDRVPMTARQRKEFQKHLPNLQKLASPKTSVSGKRKVIQEGGAIFPLIASIIPAVAGLVASAVRR